MECDYYPLPPQFHDSCRSHSSVSYCDNLDKYHVFVFLRDFEICHLRIATLSLMSFSMTRKSQLYKVDNGGETGVGFGIKFPHLARDFRPR